MLERTSGALWGRGAGCLSGVEPTSLPLWSRGVGCSSGVGTYLSDSMGQGYRLFKRCQNQPPGHCEAEVLLFKQCWNLLPEHCGAGVQAV